MNWYLKVVRDNYANFSGRAQRAEYWTFALLNIIFGCIIAVADTFISGGFIYMAYGLGILIRALAVSIRRLHDVDKSGWCLLLAFVPVVQLILLVWYCTDSTPGDNQYGPNPKGIGGPAPAADEPAAKTSDDSETGKAEAEETGEEA